MNGTRYSKKLILAASVLIAVRSASFACSCVPPKNALQELEQAAAVFTGKLVELVKHGPEAGLFARVEAVIAVERTWKGVDKKTVSVFTSSHSASCGYGFKEGREYLVYAFQDAEGRLTTTICSRTRQVKDAAEDLKELGEGKPVTAAAGKRTDVDSNQISIVLPSTAFLTRI
jgi:hypothetical protein